MIRRMSQIFAILFSITLFLGCNDSKTSNNQDSGNSVVTEVIIEKEETLSDNIDSLVKDNVEANEINIEYLYNSWKMFSWVDDGEETYHPIESNNYLLKIESDNSYIRHSINQFGNYDSIKSGKWSFDDNIISLIRNKNSVAKFKIIKLTIGEIYLQHISYNDKVFESEIIQKYKVLQDNYDFYGDYEVLD